MTEEKKLYKCKICGNIVEVMHAGVGQLVCCGEPMKELEEKTADASIEKHVPFIERKENKYVVRVGENALHPMEENHYIEWIELNADEVTYLKKLHPGEKPEAVFEIPEASKVTAREYCNVHGLWKKE